MSVNNSFQKNANLSLVAQKIWKNPGISRIGIARDLGLYRSTVGNIIGFLVEHGLVEEGEEGVSRPQGGRKPISLFIDDDFACALGLELQPDRWVARLVDPRGKLLLGREGEPEASALPEMLGEVLSKVETEVRAFDRSLLGVCVGLPGIVDVHSGTIVRSDPFDLGDFDFEEAIASKYRIPVIVENDANCCAWGDLTSERGRDLSDFISVLTEFHKPNPITKAMEGMVAGLGLALGGKVHYGKRYAAGEFMSLYRPRAFRGRAGIAVAENPGKGRKRDSIDDFASELFANLVPVATVLDPQAIFFHGELSGDPDRMLALVEERIPEFLPWARAGGCRLEFVRDEEPVASGAAAYFLRKLFSVPELDKPEVRPRMDWDAVFANAAKRNDPWRA